MCVWMYVYMYTYMYIYVYAHTHIYTHKWERSVYFRELADMIEGRQILNVQGRPETLGLLMLQS